MRKGKALDIERAVRGLKPSELDSFRASLDDASRVLGGVRDALGEAADKPRDGADPRLAGLAVLPVPFAGAALGEILDDQSSRGGTLVDGGAREVRKACQTTSTKNPRTTRSSCAAIPR